MFWLETVDSTCFKSFSVRPLCAAPTAAAACPRLRMCCVNGEPLVFSPERHQQFQVEDTFRYFKIFQDIFWWKNRMANDSEDLGGILQVELKIAIVDFRSRTRPSSVSRCETWWTPRLSETWGRPVTWWWINGLSNMNNLWIIYISNMRISQWVDFSWENQQETSAVFPWRSWDFPVICLLSQSIDWRWTELFWWRHVFGDHPKMLVLSWFYELLCVW